MGDEKEPDYQSRRLDERVQVAPRAERPATLPGWNPFDHVPVPQADAPRSYRPTAGTTTVPFGPRNLSVACPTSKAGRQQSASALGKVHLDHI